MTTTQTPRGAVELAAAHRKEAITAADRAKSAMLDAANRSFVDVVRPLVESKALTVLEVSDAAGINRQRVHELLRIYPERV